MIDRRSFLASVPAAGLATSSFLSACADTRVEADEAPRLDRLGVQLYTVREEMATDPDRTLAAIAEMGYREVELAGLYGLSPRDMRGRLDAVGLLAASSHHGVGEIRNSWEATLAGAEELGQSLIVVPSIPGDERSREALLRIADEFNRAAEQSAAAGLRFGYHNHDWEFMPLPDGTTPMNLLLDETDAGRVDWQMDVFWTVHGGADPVAELERRRGRVTSIHVKDRTAAGEMVDVGDGVIDFPDLMARAGRQGLRHAFVEHDRPGDALDSVRRSFQHLAPHLGHGDHAAGGRP